MAVMMLVTPAFANEIWDFHLRGLGVGYASGTLAPPGFYFIDDNYFLPWNPYNQYGQANNHTNVFIYLNVPQIVWSTGWKFLGADYGMGIAEAFDYTNTTAQLPPTYKTETGGAQFGAYNTVLIPYILAWKLPCDFYVRTDFALMVNDPSNSPGDSVASKTKIVTPVTKLQSKTNGNLYAWAGNDSWAFQPGVAISWLHEGWNLSYRFAFDAWTKDNDTDYQNANAIGQDWTITHRCGRWTFGVGATNTTELENDKFNAGTGYMSQPNTRQVTWDITPIVAYNFGPCSVTFMYYFNLYTQNELGGNWFQVRFVVPLGNPCPVGGK